MTELPPIGGPASRALAHAGIVTLEDVVGWSERDLLALHGVGPTALRRLQEGLARTGLPPLR